MRLVILLLLLGCTDRSIDLPEEDLSVQRLLPRPVMQPCSWDFTKPVLSSGHGYCLVQNDDTVLEVALTIGNYELTSTWRKDGLVDSKFAQVNGHTPSCLMTPPPLAHADWEPWKVTFTMGECMPPLVGWVGQ